MTSTLADPSMARALREARIRAGLSKAGAARRAGVAYVRWMSWERGDRAVSVDVLPTIAAALGVTPGTLASWCVA